MDIVENNVELNVKAIAPREPRPRIGFVDSSHQTIAKFDLDPEPLNSALCDNVYPILSVYKDGLRFDLGISKNAISVVENGALNIAIEELRCLVSKDDTTTKK